jgi:hypothetical protein
MNGTPHVLVTLSADLLRHLDQLGRTMDVPIQWMAASLVYDTIESAESRKLSLAAVHTGRTLRNKPQSLLGVPTRGETPNSLSVTRTRP